ncbi:MAG: hypothetical protein JO278_14410 [Dyella sp.]|nr:hypothetical protein [Dyella sp.]MBV8272198.1 hypothetical protein [Cupriavidus sp.]
MKLRSASFLLCLAVFVLPVQGVAATGMTARGLQGAIEGAAEGAIGLSMPEQHAAIKSEVEAEISQRDGARCHEGSSGAFRDDDVPLLQDASAIDDAPERPDGLHHAACTDCASSAMLLHEIPPAALQYQRHAQPLAVTSFTRQLYLPARRC